MEKLSNYTIASMMEVLKSFVSSRSSGSQSDSTSLLDLSSMELQEFPPASANAAGRTVQELEEREHGSQSTTEEEFEGKRDTRKRKGISALIRRKLNSLRGENASPARQSSRSSEYVQSNSSGGSRRELSQTFVDVRELGELLNDFHDENDDFDAWKENVEFLRATFRPDDNTVKALLKLRMKGRARRWLDSTPVHLRLGVSELLQRMGQVFDQRPSKLQLRRNLEGRTWRVGESFAEYFHAKIVLANKVPILEEDELIDYLIEGIPDSKIREQARMRGFATQQDLLKSFSGSYVASCSTDGCSRREEEREDRERVARCSLDRVELVEIKSTTESVMCRDRSFYDYDNVGTESSTKGQHQYEKKSSDTTMHVNGHTTHDGKQEMNEMLEHETGSLLGRVADLETQSLAQRDEIVCLRATLADALRRIAQLEGREKREDERNERRNERMVSSPLRNGHVQLRGSNQNSTPQKDIRVRQTGGSCLRNSSSSGSSQDIRDSISGTRRPVSYTHSSQLPQRRSVHYQSTGSLHSDSPSSSSVSPVPSPSPRATPLPVARSPTARSNGPPQSSLRRAKRWSSTGDFTHSPQTQGSNSQLVSSRLSASTKSLFNLFKPPTMNNVKHGTRDMQYNEEESTVRMYLRGRPVVLYVPTPLMESYDLHKVSTPPQSKLKLDWVYGYRGRDCRSNLHLLPTGEIVYFVAAVVVLYNMEEHSQRHYLGHTDDIKCIAIHPNKLVVATGQVCGTDRRDAMPHIRIWNSVSLNTLCVIGNGEFDGSICCLSFSKADGGNYLCAIDETSDHNISIWDWQKGERGTKVTETKCSVDTVVCAEWHPLERNQIVSCGKGHVSFWSLDNGGMLYKRMGIFESREKPRYVTCVAFNQSGDVLTGDSNGNIIVWGRGTNTISKIVRNMHEGSIFSICVLKDGFIVTGGGKDGKILYFDDSLNLTGEEAQIEDHFGGIRTLAEGRGSQLLIGTTRNCILVGDVGMGFNPAMLGHAEEVWGLAAHPTLPQFATAGHDRLLQMWDSLSHTIVWSKDIGEQAQSIGFSPDGNVMVVGCTSGKWLAIDSETRELYTHHTDGSEPIQVVRFSPDGTLLALGSRDNYIYIYQVNEDATKYSRVGRCMGHSSFITHLDWSADGQYLRSNSGDYELLYWNAGVCRQIPQPSMMRDMEWASHTCVISFETIGIWPEGADGTDVNNCTRSSDSKLLATGDDFGKVKLFSYPACQPKSLCHTYGGHSSHVTNVSFLQDDTRLISTGGNDTSVLQWIVNY